MRHLLASLRFVLQCVLLLAVSAGAQQTITTIAGSGPNNLPATQANLYWPVKTAVDSSGNVYIADYEAARIFKVDTQGVLTVFAGNGLNAGFAVGDGGLAVNAELVNPTSIAVDAGGNVFIADDGRVREVLAATGVIETVAGTNISPSQADGIPALQAQIVPLAIAVDGDGNLYIADTASDRVRKVDAASKIITTVVGGGNGTTPATQLSLGRLSAMVLDGSGHLYVAEQPTNTTQEILEVTLATGQVTTALSSTATVPWGQGTTTVLGVSDFAVDPAGNLWVAGVVTGGEGNADLGVVFEVAAGGATTTLLQPGTGGYVGLTWLPGGDLLLSTGSEHVVDRFTPPSGTPAVFAGNGKAFFSGESVPATEAALALPQASQNIPLSGYAGLVASDAAGDVYIADTRNDMVREVIAATGNIVTVAGIAGNQGNSGDGDLATLATLTNPNAVAVDSSGNVFIASNGVIREVTAANGKIKTVAGGLNGGATSMAADGAGNLYFATAGKVQEVLATSGNIVTVAGGNQSHTYGGPATAFSMSPDGIALDAHGNIYLSDGGVIEEVVAKDGTIQQVAGETGSLALQGDGGPALGAEMQPNGIAFDAAGNLYLADTGFDGASPSIRRIDAGTGVITTIAGGGTGFSGDGGPATQAALNAPDAIALDASGNLFLADIGNDRIRKVTNASAQPIAVLSQASVAFANQEVGVASPITTVNLSNTGIGNLTITSLAITGANAADFALTSSTTCSQKQVLLAAASCNLALSFNPSGAASESATLTISDNATPATQTVALSGTGIAPGVSLSSTNVSFGNVTVGTAAAPVQLTVANTGTSPLAITTVAFSGRNAGDFAAASGSTCAGQTVAVAATCVVQLSFTPTQNGSESAVLTFTDNASPTTQTVNVIGAGVLPTVTVAPTALSFGTQPESAASAAGVVTVSNGGPGALIFSKIALSGSFAADYSLAAGSTCATGTNVPANGSCTLAVVFTPSILGSEAASLTLTDNASGGSQTLQMNGTGGPAAPAVSLAPAALTFASQAAGTNSAAQAVTLLNSGSANLALSGITASAGFAETNACGASLAAGKSCAINVTFTPGAAGALSGALTITDNAAGSPHSVALSGTATAATGPTLSPASLTFAAQAVGSSSSAQTLTLSNAGSTALAISAIAATGDYAETNTCGASLAAGANCTIAVTFTPTVSGDRTGSLSINENAAVSPETAALDGAGADLTVAPGAGSSPAATVSAGQPASYSLQFTPVNGLSGTFALSCSGAPSGATCSPNPANISLSGSTAVPVTVTVTTTARSLVPPLAWPGTSPWTNPWLWAGLGLALLLAAWWLEPRRRRRWLVPAGAFVLLSLMAACGGGSGGGAPAPQPAPSQATGTPAGTYTLVVTASNGAVSRSSSLTLTVH